MTYYTNSSDSSIPLWLILVILSLLGVCYFAKSTGGDHYSAEKELLKWSKEMKLDTSAHSCNNYDSDDVGYVSCTYMLNGEPHSIECTASFNMQSGCRYPKPVLKNTNVNYNRSK
jgi:hypothetical protein